MILGGTQALEVSYPPPIPRGWTLGDTLGSYPGVCAKQTMYSPKGGVSLTLVFNSQQSLVLRVPYCEGPFT